MTKAVMFDIDFTLLNPFTGRRYEHMIDFLWRLYACGYTIVIITARPSFLRSYTINQLVRNCIPFHEVFFCPAKLKGEFKRLFVKYDFVLSVGDQDTDLTESTYSLKVENCNTAPSMYLCRLLGIE